jgi:hypothetical protein
MRYALINRGRGISDLEALRRSSKNRELRATTMATIVRLRPKTTTRSRPAPPGGGKIIIFPGVRYERLADEPAGKPRSRRKKA